MGSPKPATLVSEREWSQWAELLRDSHATSIWQVANQLGLSWPSTRINETIAKYIHNPLAELRNGTAIGPKKARTVVLVVASLAIPLRPVAPASDSDSTLAALAMLPSESLDALLTKCLSYLTKRERQVLEKRCALKGGLPLTLAVLGEEFEVTRERIRQIEVKALQKLRALDELANLPALLDRHSARFWELISESRGVVRADQAESQLEAKLDGYWRLALSILDIRPSALLDRCSARVGDGWVQGGTEAYRTGRVVHYLEHDRDLQTPIEADAVADTLGCSLSSVRNAAALGTTVALYAGYVCRGHVGARIRRAIWLHRLLAAESGLESVPTRELCRKYNRLRPAEPCSIRDLEIVLTRHPHLFLQMGRDAWRGIGGRPVAHLAPDNGAGQEADEETGVSADDTIVSHLREILEQTGPLRQTDLDQEVVRKTGTRFSLSGVHAILLTSGQFVRFAPGLYALPEQLEDEALLDRSRRMLLSEEGAVQYVRARFAGEPRQTYPLWNAEMEQRWCEWARSFASPAVYQSLLAISMPADWRIGSKEMSAWVAEKARQGHYWLDEEPAPELGSHLPPLIDLLAPLAAASCRQTIGWVGMNRLLRRRQNDRTTLPTLAVLIGLNAVEPNADWRAGHTSSAEAGTLYARLSTELHRRGCLTWRSDIGSEWRHALRVSSKLDLGWVPSARLPDLRLDEGGLAATVVDWPWLDTILRLGLLTAQVDGVVDPREMDAIRGYLRARAGGLPEQVLTRIDHELAELRNQPIPFAATAKLALALSPSARQALLEFLFQVAAADGLFCDKEEALLRELQSVMEIDRIVFATLYRKYRRSSDDPSASESPSSDLVVENLLDSLLLR